MTVKMDPSRFEELAMTHGPDIGRWPDAERAAAEAHLARSSEARAVRDRAAMVFSALETEAATAPPLSDALMSRVLADAAEASPAPSEARRARPRRPLGLSFLSRLAPPVAIAASAALGIALGYVAPESYGGSDMVPSEEEFWTEALNLTPEPGLFGEIDEGAGP